MLVSWGDVDSLVDRILSSDEPMSLDTETTGFSPVSDHIVGFSISCAPNHGVYVPLQHKRITEEEDPPLKGRQKKPKGPKIIKAFEHHDMNLDADAGLRIIEAIRKSGRRVAMHNAAFDLSMLEAAGWDLPNDVVCTHVAKWLLCRGKRNPAGLGLKALAKQDLGVDMAKYTDTADPRGIQYTDPRIAGMYAADDATSTLRLWLRYHEELRAWSAKGHHLLDEYFGVEMPVVRVVAHMKRSGFRLDKGMLAQFHDQLVAEQAEIRAKLNALVGCELMVSSTRQLSRLMFDTLKWWEPFGERGAVVSKDDGMAFYSTSEEAVRAQLDRATDPRGKEVALLVLRWKKLEALRARNTTSLIEAIDTDGRLRTNFNQAGTESGRFSSSDPINLQNLPRPADNDAPETWLRDLPKIRAAFIPEPGWKLIDIDFSQIELRLMAHLSGDENLLRAYQTWKCGGCGKEGRSEVAISCCPLCGTPDYVLVDGKKKKAKMSLEFEPPPGAFCLGMDIHQLTASETGASRQDSKIINFGLIYGMGPWKLAEFLEIDRDTAKKYIRKYFKAYPGVQAYQKKVEQKLINNWYVETITGRHRAFDKVGVTDESYGYTVRSAVNTTVQGSAADLMKIAMRNVYERLEEGGYLGDKVRILSTVHDELISECRADYVDEVLALQKHEFEHAMRLRVPIVADPQAGGDWSSIH